MADRLFSRRKDLGYLESIHEVKVAYSRENGIALTVVTTSQVPPTWFESLKLDLVHDEGWVKVACDVTHVSQRKLQYTLTLKQATEGDFVFVFGVRPSNEFLDLSQVVIRTPWNSDRTFANQTSRAALRAVVL